MFTMKDFENFQKLSKENMEVAAKSFGEINKGFQAIATEMSDFSKKAYEDGSSAAEKIMGAKSMDKAIEIQSEYARKAYEDYMAGMTKIGELYSDLAKEMYKPVEKAMSAK